MENEETVETQDTQTESQAEVVEETTAEQTSDESQSETNDVHVEAELARAKAEAAKYRRLFEKTQAKQAVVTPKASAAPSQNIEETVLLANGMSEDLMENLKKVAAVQGISLIKAQNDPIFIAVKEKLEKDKKKADASMGASRGSGSVKVKKTASTPGLTREEHMALVNQ